MLTKGCAMIIMFLQTHHTHRLSRLITTSVYGLFYGLLVSLLLGACGGGGGGGGASPVVSGGPAIQTGRAACYLMGSHRQIIWLMQAMWWIQIAVRSGCFQTELRWNYFWSSNLSRAFFPVGLLLLI